MSSTIAITLRPTPAFLLYLAFFGAFLADTARAADAPRVEANKVAEITFEAATPHPGPFMQVTLDVEFTDPAGAKELVPACWANLWWKFADRRTVPTRR